MKSLLLYHYFNFKLFVHVGLKLIWILINFQDLEKLVSASKKIRMVKFTTPKSPTA